MIYKIVVHGEREIIMTNKIQMLDKTLVNELLLKNRCLDNLWKLCDYGTRFAGTQGERKARDFIVDELNDYGLQVKLESFEHQGWKRGTASVKILEPFERELLTISLAGGPSTDSEGITGEIVFVGNGTPAEFNRVKDQIKGNIVLSSSLAPKNECIPPRQCHRRTKYGRAVELGASAFIFMNSQMGMLPQTGSLRQNRLGEIPAVTVPFEEGELLKRYLSMGKLKIRITAENESFVNRTSNVVVELPGRNQDEIVLIGGHYDCHDNSPGAGDNGAGVTTILELARILALSKVEFEKTIRFVFFGVEELACVGSSFYVLNHLDEHEKIKLMLNIDSPAQRGGKTFDVGGFNDLGEFILQAANEISYPMKLRNPSFGGDQISFIVRGIPAASIRKSSTQGIFSNQDTTIMEDRGWGHTSADTPDKIRAVDINEGAIITGRVLIRAAMHKGPIAMHRSENEVNEILQRHGMDEVLDYMQWPNIPIYPW
jgi:Iap family predicted aminopeptidase